MKKIILVSDTHGKTANLRTLMKRIRQADLLLHMGDVEGDEGEIESFAGCPVEFVRGNCDSFSKLPDDRLLEIEGHRILMTHGHRYGVGYSLAHLDETAREKGADIVLYGHTHVPEYVTIGDRHFINPGSISRPRQEGHQPSYAILEIDRKGQVHVTLNTL